MNHSSFRPQPRQLIRTFHMMAKPVGSQCNMECGYCYYLHKKEVLPGVTTNVMTDEILEEFIRRYIAEQDDNTIFFTWHGGEPALLGVDYFRKVVQWQQKHAAGKRIENCLQTNGLLIDDVWCEFFKEHGFLIGLSIDGPKHLHDPFRTTKGGGPTFDGAYQAARLLQKHDVSFNTLTVVHSLNAKHAEDVYLFLIEDLGSRCLQLLPCVELKNYRSTAPLQWNSADLPILGTDAAKPGHPDSIVTDWSVDPDDWGDFLCRTFDIWLKNGLGKVVVNWFESLVGQWMLQPAQVCTLAEVCGRSLVVERDGSLYSCDRFVYPEFKVGHVSDTERQLADIVYSPEQRKFGCHKRDRLTNYCKQCKYRFACNGDCPKNRFVKSPDGQPGVSYFCSGLKRFLAHADPYLQQIVANVQQAHPVPTSS